MSWNARTAGTKLLSHSMYNKSTAFPREERALFGLESLLPEVVTTIEKQARRAYGNIVCAEDPLDRYIGLAALQDRNEHLFYHVLINHLEEFLPIVSVPRTSWNGRPDGPSWPRAALSTP